METRPRAIEITYTESGSNSDNANEDTIFEEESENEADDIAVPTFNKRAFYFDFDNTLTKTPVAPWQEPEQAPDATLVKNNLKPGIIPCFNTILQEGDYIAIITNSSINRVKHYLTHLQQAGLKHTSRIKVFAGNDDISILRGFKKRTMYSLILHDFKDADEHHFFDDSNDSCKEVAALNQEIPVLIKKEKLLIVHYVNSSPTYTGHLRFARRQSMMIRSPIKIINKTVQEKNKLSDEAFNLIIEKTNQYIHENQKTRQAWLAPLYTDRKLSFLKQLIAESYIDALNDALQRDRACILLYTRSLYWLNFVLEELSDKNDADNEKYIKCQTEHGSDSETKQAFYAELKSAMTAMIEHWQMVITGKLNSKDLLGDLELTLEWDHFICAILNKINLIRSRLKNKDDQGFGKPITLFNRLYTLTIMIDGIIKEDAAKQKESKSRPIEKMDISSTY